MNPTEPRTKAGDELLTAVIQDYEAPGYHVIERVRRGILGIEAEARAEARPTVEQLAEALHERYAAGLCIGSHVHFGEWATCDARRQWTSDAEYILAALDRAAAAGECGDCAVLEGAAKTAHIERDHGRAAAGGPKPEDPRPGHGRSMFDE